MLCSICGEDILPYFKVFVRKKGEIVWQFIEYHYLCADVAILINPYPS